MWEIKDDTARWKSDRLEGSVDLVRPILGFQDPRLVGRRWDDARLFGIVSRAGSATSVIEDRYVRGLDLVVTYGTPPGSSVRPQVYWRMLDDRGTPWFGLEVVLSVQTPEMNVTPDIYLLSRLEGESLFALPLGAESAFREVSPEQPGTFSRATHAPLFLLRDVAPRLSYAELIYPSDWHEAAISFANGRWETRYRLLAETLEKGVIRRVRARGVFLPRDRDESLARDFFRTFVASPLPLTT